MNIYDVYARWQPGFRSRRRELFLEIFRPTEETTILDVGGTLGEWVDLPVRAAITVMNLDDAPATEPKPANITYRVGDGRTLEFPDRSFDIAYSNSVIEHVGTREDQRRFAAEMLRVGSGVFVQTPNRWFPIEPHFVSPGVHFLPGPVARRLLPWLSVRGWFREGDNVSVQQLLTELRLLDAADMQTFFPKCELVRERWCGLTKSLIAVRRTELSGAGVDSL